VRSYDFLLRHVLLNKKISLVPGDFRMKLFKILCALGLSLSIFTLVACAGGPTTPAVDCPAPPTGSSEYQIGPGDTLDIVAWRNEELSASVPVRPDGRISTPLVDDMVASGKTPSQLSRDIEAVLQEYVRSPKVSVIVTAQGASNQIQVVGEVESPQAMSYRAGLRVLDIVVGVGGLTDFAAGNRTNLVRQTDSGQVECRVRVKDILSGDMSQNILVYPGDVIVVPETRL
jgi:polysaccharide export outer membrane protein